MSGAVDATPGEPVAAAPPGVALEAHWIYAMYSGGVLLYIGRTCSPKRRFEQHHHKTPWISCVTELGVSTDWYERAEAAERETGLIRRNRPPMNITSNPDYEVLGNQARRAEYQRRVDLLLTTWAENDIPPAGIADLYPRALNDIAVKLGELPPAPTAAEIDHIIGLLMPKAVAA